MKTIGDAHARVITREQRDHGPVKTMGTPIAKKDDDKSKEKGK